MTVRNSKKKVTINKASKPNSSPQPEKSFNSLLIDATKTNGRYILMLRLTKRSALGHIKGIIEQVMSGDSNAGRTEEFIHLDIYDKRKRKKTVLADFSIAVLNY